MTQIRELLAMVAIGDGILGLVEPRRHVARWAAGPWAGAMTWARRRPGLTRAMAGTQLLVALWYVRRLPPQEPTP